MRAATRLMAAACAGSVKSIPPTWPSPAGVTLAEGLAAAALGTGRRGGESDAISGGGPSRVVTAAAIQIENTNKPMRAE